VIIKRYVVNNYESGSKKNQTFFYLSAEHISKWSLDLLTLTPVHYESQQQHPTKHTHSGELPLCNMGRW